MASAKNSGLIDKLRTWRRDASSLHQYDAAAFVGDKILSMTGTSTTSAAVYCRGRFRCVLAGAYLLSHSILRASLCSSC